MDLRREGSHNQTRTVSVGVFNVAEAAINDDAIVATLPERTLILSVILRVKAASSTSNARVSIGIGSRTIVHNSPVTTVDDVNRVTPVHPYSATGGDLIIKDGSVQAPAAGDLELEVVVEYIALDTVDGNYIG